MDFQYSFAGNQGLLAGMAPGKPDRLSSSVHGSGDFLPVGHENEENADGSNVAMTYPFLNCKSRLVVNNTFAAHYKRIECLRQQAGLEGYSINTMSEAALLEVLLWSSGHPTGKDCAFGKRKSSGGLEGQEQIPYWASVLE